MKRVFVVLLMLAVVVESFFNEHAISKYERISLENGSLYNEHDEHGRHLLLTNVQGFLFDSNRLTIFYKRNGSVYSSIDHQLASSSVESTSTATTLQRLGFAIAIFAFVLATCIRNK